MNNILNSNPLFESTTHTEMDLRDQNPFKSPFRPQQSLTEKNRPTPLKASISGFVTRIDPQKRRFSLMFEYDYQEATKTAKELKLAKYEKGLIASNIRRLCTNKTVYTPINKQYLHLTYSKPCFFDTKNVPINIYSILHQFVRIDLNILSYSGAGITAKCHRLVIIDPFV